MIIHDIFVSNNSLIVEYTTRHGARRFDISPYIGQRTLRIPVENAAGRWETKVFPIEEFIL